MPKSLTKKTATGAAPAGQDSQPDLFSASWSETTTTTPNGAIAKVTTETQVIVTKPTTKISKANALNDDPFAISVEDQEILARLAEEEEAFAPPAPRVLTVTEIAGDIRDTLKDTYGDILVKGEVCDYKGTHRSGHLYFGLKDAGASIRAVMWKGALAKVPFDIKAGLEVVVTGRIDFYPGSGSLQIIAERMDPLGVGALQLKFEQLKEKLKLEGLFDTSKKRVVPPLNWRIGIVTSKTTAALQDMLRIYKTRFPLAEIFLFNASVQGEKAPVEVVQAIERANRFSAQASKPLNVIVVTRGGGSYEDLFCFNDERIVRAIAQSKIPTVSAVGHEIDVTLADFVADKRSATPSHAAQETVPEAALWQDRLRELEAMFVHRMDLRVSDARQRIDTLYSRLVAAAPQKKIEFERSLLLQKYSLIRASLLRTLEKRKTDVARLSSVLDALSPLKVMDRGYSIVCIQPQNKALHSVKDVKSGDRVNLIVKDGQIKATID